MTYAIPAPNHEDEPVELVLSFLSPITPTSTLRQSIPASYISVHVSGTFNIDVYIDVNGQWVSGHREARIVWDFEHNALDDKHRLKTFKVTREEELLFTENRGGGNAQAEWGSLYFTAPSVRPENAITGGTDANSRLGCSPRVRYFCYPPPALLRYWNAGERG